MQNKKNSKKYKNSKNKIILWTSFQKTAYNHNGIVFRFSYPFPKKYLLRFRFIRKLLLGHNQFVHAYFQQ